MPPHRPNLLRIFLAKITRSIAFNRYKAGHARRRGGGQIELVLDELSECLEGESCAEEFALARELGEFIRRFVRSLPTRDGDIFARRYFFTEYMKALSKSTMISLSEASTDSIKRSYGGLPARRSRLPARRR